jgi:hypothetical protein
MTLNMVAFRYSVGDLLRRMPASIGIHWPGERLMLVAPCISKRGHLRSNDPVDDSGPATRRRPYWELPAPSTPGFLGATQARVILEDRTTPVTVIRGIAMVLGALGALMLPFGDGIVVPVGFLLVGGTLWILARALELFTLGRTTVAFDRVFVADEGSRHLDAFLDDGSVIRFQMVDAIAFFRLAALLSGGDAAAA